MGNIDNTYDKVIARSLADVRKTKIFAFQQRYFRQTPLRQTNTVLELLVFGDGVAAVNKSDLRLNAIKI